jgi:hypothetical protein
VEDSPRPCHGLDGDAWRGIWQVPEPERRVSAIRVPRVCA